MEPFLDNNDGEIHARRAARIEQMKREKQLQEQRRRMIKKYLPYGAGALAVVIILVVTVSLFVGKSKEKENQQAEADIFEMSVEQNKDIVENTQNLDIAASEEDKQIEEEMVQVNAGIKKNSDTPKYTFAETDDTVAIYSEDVISTNAILINENTDTIIASKGAYERINPASMTKVLTVLVAAEAIAEEELDNTFTMTQEITDYSYVNDCSSVGFLADEVVTLRDLFYGTTLHSGGDAAVGLATYVAGSNDAFVDKMNVKLEELGIAESTHFTNCVGLYDENHYSTVYDMAIIMKAAMQNELCRDFLSLHIYTTSTTEQHPEGITISNWFLRKIEDKDTSGEVLCAKTGYVVQSKNCAVSYENHENGSSYICVTTGSTSSWRCIYDHVEIYNQYIKTE